MSNVMLGIDGYCIDVISGILFFSVVNAEKNYSRVSHLSFDGCFCSSMVDLCIYGLMVLLEL